MKSFIIKENDANQRVDKFLEKAVPLLPKSLLHKYIRIKRIKLNEKRCEPITKLSLGDELKLYINDEFFSEPSNPNNYPFLAAPSHLDILYEDSNILVVDKRVGLIVHEDSNQQTDTLVNRILHYLYKTEQYNPTEENSFTPALCNRIDQYTGGIVLAAKNAQALRVMNQKMKDREVRKFYLALVHGVPDPKEATLTAHLVKDEGANRVQVTATPVAGSKPISTTYRTLRSNGSTTLLEVELHTGRSHQIRAHMAFLGHPLVGDGKYGKPSDGSGLGYRNQALYSYKISFAFTSDAGVLANLNNQTFTVKAVPFTALP